MAKRWEVMASLVNQHNLRVGAEIGVADGKFFSFMLDHCPELSMACIDPWAPTPFYDQFWKPEVHDRNLRLAQERAARFDGRCKLWRGASIQIAPAFGDGHFDFVFIDADHSYEGASSDIAAWTPKVRPGGFICGHDYQPRFQGVIDAVDEVFPRPELKSDNVWIARKD